MSCLRSRRSIAALAIAGLSWTPALAQEDPAQLTGSWVLNLEQSIPPQGRTFSPFTVVVHESGDILDFTQYTTHPSGQVSEFSHRSPTDGVVRELPGMPGARAAFTRLPSGVIDAQLWFPDGSLQNKFCVLQPSRDRQVCLATITSPSGTTVFFRHVLDRVDPD